jgi:uncharacterized membrane protein
MAPLVKAGLVLGLGLGGFADGIVLHQILGWHHLICTADTCQPETVAALKLQNTQDGFFHLGTWLLTLAGTGMLFRAARAAGQPWSGRALAGALLAGWGVFNLAEGLVNHTSCSASIMCGRAKCTSVSSTCCFLRRACF